MGLHDPGAGVSGVEKAEAAVKAGYLACPIDGLMQFNEKPRAVSSMRKVES